MSSAAQLAPQMQEPLLDAPLPVGDEAPPPSGDTTAGLRRVAGERLAEHKRRRAVEQAAAQAAEAESAARQSQLRGSASRVRDAVAARYQNSVSYREFLAQEAARALEQAHAEAEIAARNARAVADAQMQLLEEMKQWEEAPGPRALALAEIAAQSRDAFTHAIADIAVAATEAMHLTARVVPSHADASTDPLAAGLTVRLYQDLSPAPQPPRATPRPSADSSTDPDAALAEASALDAEIAFRLAPEFAPQVPEPVAATGNLIAFPRQLVAARKARPRLAEGPLREESAPEPQLRIFEVEPEQISIAPADTVGAPEWQGLLLDQAPAPLASPASELHSHIALPPQTASIELRLMAFTVDAACIAASMLAFVSVVVRFGAPALRALPLARAGAGAAATLLAFFLLYQLLFFSLSDATPGMRYARIALCTFGDANPPRSALRRRVLATLLAACPLGIGLAWAALDEDSLGWHDRMSRMYQRAY